MIKYLKLGIVHIFLAYLTICASGSDGSDRKISEENNLYTSLPNCEIISLVQKRNLTEIETVLKKGVDINCQNKYGKTALMIAAAHNADAVPLLLDHGADPNLVDHHGRTALMDAQEQSNLSSMRYLIEAGADLEKKEPDMGYNVLMQACSFGTQDIVELLLEAGANPNAKDNHGETALMINMRNEGNYISLLIKHGANLNESGKNGQTALTLAAEYGSTKTINTVLGYKPDLNFLDPNKYSPLFSAVLNKNTDALELFVKAGLNINAVDKEGQNALLRAAICQKRDAVKKLVALGLDINSVDKSGRPFFSLMVSEGYNWEKNEYAIMVKFFQQLGADINKQDNAGMTPLMHATANSNYKAFEVLVDAGADSTAKDPNGRTYVDYLPISSSPESVKILKIAVQKHIISSKAIAALITKDAQLNQVLADANIIEVNLPAIAMYSTKAPDINEIITMGRDINARDKEGKTLLIRMCEQGCDAETLKSILLAKADINIKDNENRDALMAAAEKCSSQVVKRLIDAGADIKAVNNIKKNVLMYACQNRDANVAAMLLPRFDVNVGDVNDHTALMYAAQSGRPETVERLIRAGADIKAVGHGNMNLLMFASMNPDANVVELFIKHFDVNLKDEDHWTALMWAARYGCEKTVKRLIQAGADVKATSVSGKDALINAIQQDNIAIMKLLIDNGADVTSKRNNHFFSYPLGQAAIYARNKQTILFIVDQITKKEKPDEQIFTALNEVFYQYYFDLGVYTEISKGVYIEMSEEVMDCLKELAAKTDIERYKKGLTNCLAEKISHVQNIKIIRELIDSGADPNGVDKSGTTVLMHAATNSKPEIIQAILEYKTNIDTVTGNYTALHHAVSRNSNPEIADTLVKAGASIGNKAIYGNLAEAAGKNDNKDMMQWVKEHGLYSNSDNGKILAEAALNSKLATVKDMIAAGVSRDDLSKTLLDIAGSGLHTIENGVDLKYEIIKELVNAGADVNAEEAGESPWTVLMRLCGDSRVPAEVVELFIRNGADINVKGRGKSTPLIIACASGSLEAVRVLVKAGANLEDKSSMGETPLLLSLKRDHLDVFDLLISSGAKVDESNSYDLLQAVLLGSISNKNIMMDKLMSAGVKINAVNNRGQSILMSLCERSSDASLILLVLDKGADSKLQDKRGCDARYFAEKNPKLKNSGIFSDSN